MIRLGLTGTVVEDTIERLDGRRVEDMGGAYYALLAARAILPSQAALVPVMAVGDDAWERVRADLDALPGVVLDGLVRRGEVNNKVRLEYRSAGERDETLTGGVGPLVWDDLEPWAGRLDAWLWNFVSGRETDLATFSRLKGAFGGPIHLDLHSLCLAEPGDGPRRPRRPPEWEAWVEGVRWVQCNEWEAALLWTGRTTPLDERGEAAFAARVAALGAEGVLLSRGAGGASWIPGAGDPVRAPARGTDGAIDPTGCGDVLGGAWFALRAGRGVEAAAALAGAVRAAGRAAGISGTADLYPALAAEGEWSG